VAGDDNHVRRASTPARAARARRDVDALLELLSSTERTDRISAIANLGGIVDPRVLAALRRCLQAEDQHLRIGALNAFAESGVRDAIPEIAACARDDPSLGARVVAVQALPRLGDDPVRIAALIVENLRRDDLEWPRWYRRWAAKHLARYATVETIPHLELALPLLGVTGRARIRRTIRSLRQQQQQRLGGAGT
jgi:HEAT repeat protein